MDAGRLRQAKVGVMAVFEKMLERKKAVVSSVVGIALCAMPYAAEESAILSVLGEWWAQDSAGIVTGLVDESASGDSDGLPEKPAETVQSDAEGAPGYALSAPGDVYTWRVRDPSGAVLREFSTVYLQVGGEQPTSNAWWSSGLLWVMLKSDGIFNVLVNGHQYSLTNGAEPVSAAAEFRAGQYNLVELRYYSASNRVAVRIKREMALPPTPLPAGFTLLQYDVNGGWGGAVMTKDVSRIDNFRYQPLDEYFPS
jgi:hypothetical protein